MDNEPIGHAMMTQQRLIDYRNRDENSRCVLSNAFSLSPSLCLITRPYLRALVRHTVGVITVQTGDHLQARTGSNYNVIDVTRDPKV